MRTTYRQKNNKEDTLVIFCLLMELRVLATSCLWRDVQLIGTSLILFIPLPVFNNYLCTYDLYGPVRNVLMRADSLRGEVGGGWRWKS